MKKLNIRPILVLFAFGFLFSGCYKLQTDYKYQKYELDPHYDMTAKQFLLSRGTNGAGSDTVFKWMQLGIEYAGIDMSEYEKTGRTFIFLHNNAIKVWDNTKKIVTGGFFFDYPIMVKDSAGNKIKSKIDPTMDSTRPAISWNEYPQEMVKNYFLYLTINGEFGFDNLHVENQPVTTLLPAGTVASGNDSRLGWVVTKTTPNPDVTGAANIFLSSTGGTGFDPEGKMNLRIGNNDASPIVVNDRTNDRTAGYYFTNGRVHVYDKTIHPFRYSWQ
jgi:hypothetical protein